MNTPQDWIENAELRLEAAHLLFESEMYVDSLTRTYFAVFQAAKAVLASKGIHVGSHSGVHSKIGEREPVPYALDTGLVSTLSSERDECDYGLAHFPRPHVEKRLREAEAFIGDAVALL